MQQPGENIERQTPTQTSEKTPGTPTDVDQVRSARRKRIAALLFLGASRLLGAGSIGTVAAANAGCGARTELPTDEYAVVDGHDDGGTVDAGPDGSMGIDAGPDGSMGIDAGPDGSMGVECNKVSIVFEGPTSATIAKGTTNIPAHCINIKNGCKDGVLKNLTYQIKGPIASDDIELALADTGGGRFTNFVSASPITPSGSPEIKLGGFEIPMEAYTSKTVCAYVNISPDTPAGSNFSVKFLKPKPGDHFMTNEPDTSGIPDSIEGNSRMVGTPVIGKAFISAGGDPSPLFSGQSNGTIANLQITGPDTESSDFARLSLHFGGTCDPSNIKNVALYDGPTEVCSTYPTFGNSLNIVHLGCSPYLMGAGQTKKFSVKADQTCPPGTSISTSLGHPTDLYMSSKTFGHGEQVEGYDGEGSKGGASYVEIK